MRWPARALLPPGVVDRLRTLRGRRRTRHPIGFNDKVLYKIYRDRRPLLVTFADKIAARDYVARQGTACTLADLYATTADLRSLDRARLPGEFVVKASHLSGGVILVSDWADPDGPTPTPGSGFVRTAVHPDRLDWAALTELTDEWMDATYRGPMVEWAYSKVPPRLLVEELLRDDRGRAPTDYKFWVFHGICRVVEVALDRFEGEIKELMFTPTWQLIADGPYDEAWAGLAVRPSRLDAMLAIAEQLGRATDFVRVDLYQCGDRIVFGELTNYPGGGHEAVLRPTVDRALGAYWRVPRRYRDDLGVGLRADRSDRATDRAPEPREASPAW